MEKFGIFELLDALSAITETASPTPETQESDAPSAGDAEKKRPDAAFAPPSYGGEVPPPPTAEQNALGAFYARHDGVKGRVKKDS